MFFFQTPLHMSAEHGYVSNVKQLLLHGADLVARDSSGLTPLDIAEKSEHVECMLVLKQTAGEYFVVQVCDSKVLGKLLVCFLFWSGK
jgi:ankyrin repeat protein